MFQSIMKFRRPFSTDDLCLKVALMLNYVPVTQNTNKSPKSLIKESFFDVSKFAGFGEFFCLKDIYNEI